MKEISQTLLQEWMDTDKEFILIDVRDPQEHAAHNIGGHLVPLTAFNQSLPILDTHLPVVVYCRKGIRSQIAIQRWKRRFPNTDFFNLKAGIGESSS